MVFTLPLKVQECLVTTNASRRPTGALHYEHHRQHRARMTVVCMGRNDGSSGNRRRGTHRTRPRPEFPGPSSTDDRPWYDADEGLQSGSAADHSGAAARTLQQPSTSKSSPSARANAAAPRGGTRQGRRQPRAYPDEDSDDEDPRGWWERPEERSLQAYAALSLEQWQEERLQRAYAAGRRKAQIQDLARELDVDRSVVLAWFKEFSLRPQSERDAILSPLRAEAEQEARRQKAAHKDTAAVEGPARWEGAAPASASTSTRAAAGPAAAAAAPGAAAKSGQEGPSGFIPFYLRKQMGMDKQQQRRLKGEVLRTLESIYDRTPFPSAEVIRGLFELHRLPKEVATEWFAARRAADGISSSTQKRAARPSQREKDRDIEGAFSGGPGEDDEEGAGLNGFGASSSSSASSPSSGMLAQLGGAAASQQSQQQQEPAEPTVVTLSRREMAALRSSLPSPTKHKGMQMAEKMGIKTAPGAPATQIGNVQYVEDVPAVPAGDRMRASWRFRSSSGPSTAGGGGGSGGSTAAGTAAGGRRLRLRGRSTGRSAGGDAGAGGVFLGEEDDE